MFMFAFLEKLFQLYCVARIIEGQVSTQGDYLEGHYSNSEET